MKSSPYFLAALAVGAIEGLEAVGVRPPYSETDDFVTGCVLDARGRRWVVKCPRNLSAATMLEAEAALAPSLLHELRAGNLPFDIVRPAGFADVKTGGRAVVYPEPFGQPWAFERLDDDGTRELARAIASIHMLSPDVVSRAGLPVYSAEDCRIRQLTELQNANHASPISPVLVRRWENALEDSALWNFEPVMVHGDVASENFLWSNDSISTVCGFGEAHVGDPATDLAPLVALGDDFFDIARESYENTRGVTLDSAAYSRSQLLSELAIVRWLLFGLRTENRDVVADAREMLDDLAREVESHPELNPGPAWHVDPEVSSVAAEPFVDEDAPLSVVPDIVPASETAPGIDER
ncbi:phosphotransferase [Arcanobacterium haemolyticum]|nr:phosphotransferase [Arcanobacterium haemolyticum]